MYMFLEAFEDYIDITDKFDAVNMKIEAYVESVVREFNINKE